MGLNVSQLAKEMTAVFIGSLKDKAPDIQRYAAREARKLAQRLAKIEKSVLAGMIDEDEARLQLDIQKNATQIILLKIEGLERLAVEQAINSALNVVIDMVNPKLRLALLDRPSGMNLKITGPENRWISYQQCTRIFSCSPEPKTVGVNPPSPPILLANPTQDPSPLRENTEAAEREITVTGHDLDGRPLMEFKPQQTYRLRFQVCAPSDASLVTGDTAVGAIPHGGLQTHWVVTTSDVQFVPELSTASVQSLGESWVAEFDLLIPEIGESEAREVAVLIGMKPGKILVTLYAVSRENRRELYRQLTADLSAGPRVDTDTTAVAAGHTHLRTSHEWTTPLEHVQVSVLSGLASVTTVRATENEYTFIENWPATDTRLAGAIQNVRSSLERFRENWDRYLSNLDPTDIDTRLQSVGNWKPYFNSGNGWQPLPDVADDAYRKTFEEAQKSVEWRNLASDGYALFDMCFPRGSKLRTMIEKLTPGSRVDFHWTNESGPGWVSHVPWALMHMEPVDVMGAKVPDPERFFGLRFRIGSRAWAVSNSSRALGGQDRTRSVHLLYWGDKQGDVVADESRWQAAKYVKRQLTSLLPSGTQLDPKKQVITALDAPSPSPMAVIYFYCHCSVGDGTQPCLRFGNTSQPQDTVKRNELSQRQLSDAPLVFANACTTVQADPHMTSELEDSFFRRGVRAFIGTETKVPVPLASKFAWLFFQFFYRQVDPAPMAAGEALTQTRLFLWTQYRNVGGLFYSLVNQYDLFLASKEEVAGLRQ